MIWAFYWTRRYNWYFSHSFLLPMNWVNAVEQFGHPLGGGRTPYKSLYREAPSGRGTFFGLWVYEGVGIQFVEVYERVRNLPFRSVKWPKKGYRRRLWLWRSRENCHVWWSIHILNNSRESRGGARETGSPPYLRLWMTAPLISRIRH